MSPDALPLERVLGAQLGRFVQQLHEEHGVRFHLGRKLRAIHPTRVELDDGHVLAAGSRRARRGCATAHWARREGTGSSRPTESSLIPSLPYECSDIWAAGDVARYPELVCETTVRIEHWVVAQRQGQAVARDMLGLGAPFRDVPFFWSRALRRDARVRGTRDAEDAIEVNGSLPSVMRPWSIVAAGV